MPAHICTTCGAQYPEASSPPPGCRICDDPRQYVGWGGQQWATLDQLAASGRRTSVWEEEPRLWGIDVEPSFAIGQRGLLVTTGGGNVLWDVPGFVDEMAIDRVRELGGLSAISASHPHFYGVMVEWSLAFGGAPIFLPEADRRWITRPDVAMVLYADRVDPIPGVSIIQVGGHFPGSAVLHWPDGAEGRGALLVGDTLQVAQDRDWVSVMWSYPNLIPVDDGVLDRIEATVEALRYDRVYGGWKGKVVAHGAAEKVRRSFERYRQAGSDTSGLEP